METIKLNSLNINLLFLELNLLPIHINRNLGAGDKLFNIKQELKNFQEKRLLITKL